MSNKPGKLHIDWRRGLIPLSLLAMFVLTFYYKVPWYALAVFVMWIPIYYVGFPWYLRRAWTNFERDFATQFQRRQYKPLLKLYKDQWFLRKFGPRAEMLGKLALIYSGMEKFREAEKVLEEAIDLTPKPYRDRLYYNLANVKYELGKYDQSEQMYKALRKNSPYRHSVRAQIALIDVQRGKRVEQARAILKNELPNATGVTRSRIEKVLGVSAS